MKKMIVAFAAVAAMSVTLGAAEANGRGGKSTVKQTGQFSSGGLVNISPNLSVGGVLNGAAILSGNGIGILGTGILSSTTKNLTSVTKNYQSGNTYDSGNTYNSNNRHGGKRGR